ncbi:MAG: segregation/condensation protein A [Malacoplasma sp.]
MSAIDTSSFLIDFKVSINDFSGPFDLLLALVKERKMDIMSIDLLVVSQQYVDFIHEHISQMKIDDMIEYLSMASYLLELKSKKILPVIDTYEKLNDDMERDKFIQRLLVYKQYKDIVPNLVNRINERLKMHSRENNSFNEYLNLEENETFLPDNIDLNKIISAMQKVYSKFQDKKTNNIKVIDVNEVSIEDVENDIKNYLHNFNNNSKISLTSFLLDIPGEKFSKQYFVVTFVALLVLVRNLYINLEQKDDGEIYIIITNVKGS